MESINQYEPESILPADDAPDIEDEFAALDDVLDAQDATIDPLAIEAGTDDDVTLRESLPPPIGRSWAFDFSRGTFLYFGHGPLDVRGLGTLRSWIEKCLMTDRGAFAIHPPDYGVEDLTEVIGDPLDYSAGADLERRITEALLFHPRISDISDFVRHTDEVEEAITLSFTVVTDAEELVTVEDLLLRVG